ncbi:MAG: hypothetical protein E7473_07730 [Ruminococcaceae bacterium]|nr:hypothetical protein [Oscillospiraceae bacterium]
MKRLLSIILALALIIGMIPVVFATETEEIVVWSPTYVFNNTTGATAWAVGSKVTDTTKSAMWEIVGTPNVSGAIGATYFQYSTPGTEPGENALVISLSVDKSGRYASDLVFSENRNYTGLIDCYIVHKDIVTEKGWDVTKTDFLASMIAEAKRNDLTADVRYIASMDINSTADTTTKTYWEEPEVVLDKGENYLVLVINKSSGTLSGSKYFGELRSYSLTCKGTVTTTVDSNELRVGKSTVIESVVTDGTGTVCDASVTYRSSNESVATVENGTVKAVGEGSATIIATAVVGGVEIWDTIEISSELVQGKIEATVDKTALKKGETAKITVSAKDADGNPSDAVITYKSSNTNAVTIDTNGNITAVGEGKSTITAYAEIDGIEISSNGIDIVVSVVWDPVYNFSRGAFTTQPTDGAGAGSWLVQYATDPSLLDSEVSTGEWKYAGGFVTSFPSTSLQKDYLSIYNSFGSANYAAIVMEITVDASAYYKPTFAFYKYTKANVLNMWVASKEEFDNSPQTYDLTKKDDVVNTLYAWEQGKAPTGGILGTKLGVVDTFDVSASLLKDSYTAETSVYLTAGKYYLFIQPTKGTGWEKYQNGEISATTYICPISLTLTRQPSIEVTAERTSIEAGKTSALASVVKDNRDNVVDATVTYTSDNTAVAKVVGNVVTGISEGTANITATATVGGATVTDTVEITVTEASAPKTITLAYSNNVDNEIIVKGRNYVRGDEVTLTADEISGYTFRHWVRGTAESGDWVSADAEYTFTLATNTYLTAVYTANSEDKIVEFFNGNGEYLSEAAVLDGKVTLPETNPTLTGFAFIRWLIGKDTELTSDTILTDDITRAVAEFGSDGTSYTVGATSYGYDDEVTNTSETATAWFRDGVQVGYGTSYTYYVWANVGEITSGEGTQKPLVVLDATAKNGARMIEYDAGGKEIIEVGILFGDSTSITVDSCEYKATSQKKLSHGQFTAKPNGDETVARGYLIYNDNGTYKVVYSN